VSKRLKFWGVFAGALAGMGCCKSTDSTLMAIGPATADVAGWAHVPAVNGVQSASS
jgi:electron transfer flavoprotein alpha/beta subunit